MRNLKTPSFTLTEPKGAETPILVEVPHAGLFVPATCLANLVVSASAIGRDADLYVDELFGDAPLEGATLLVANESRYVLDLNRAESDVDIQAVDGASPGHVAPRGLVWRVSSDGARVLSRPVTQTEFDARLERLYRPYHRIVDEVLARKTARFGYAMLLAAHSMPSVGRAGHGDSNVVRADVVPGTRGRTSAHGALIDAVDAHARASGWTVRHDEPYRGGFSTQHYGRPGSRRHAVQVELARRLYMDEASLERRLPHFENVRAWCRALVARLGSIRVT